MCRENDRCLRRLLTGSSNLDISLALSLSPEGSEIIKDLAKILQN